MIWLTIPIVLLVMMIVAIRRKWGGECYADAVTGWAVGAGLAWLGIIIVGATATSIVIGQQKELIKARRDMVILVERYGAVETIIKAYASKYPMEEDLFKNINPLILLKLPEIKSDKFLMEQIKLAISYQTAVFNCRLWINDIKRRLEYHQERWFSPTFASPEYEDLESESQ